MRVLLKEAWFTVRASQFDSFSSTLALALALCVLGLVGILAGATQEVAGRAREWIDMEVYVSDSLTEDGIEAMRRDLIATPGVVDASFVTKEAAIHRYAEFADTAALSVLSSNPLPTSFIVTLDEDAKTPVAVRGLIALFSGWPDVEAVDADLTWIQGLHRVIVGTGLVTVVFGLTIGLAVTYIVRHTIAMGASARRGVIEMMRHLGAPEGFIRRPFVLVGVVQGAVAASVACLVIWAAAGFCRDIPIIGDGVTNVVVQTVWLGLMVVGTGLGWVSSISALKRAIPPDPWAVFLAGKSRRSL